MTKIHPDMGNKLNDYEIVSNACQKLLLIPSSDYNQLQKCIENQRLTIRKIMLLKQTHYTEYQKKEAYPLFTFQRSQQIEGYHKIYG